MLIFTPSQAWCCVLGEPLGVTGSVEKQMTSWHLALLVSPASSGPHDNLGLRFSSGLQVCKVGWLEQVRILPLPALGCNSVLFRSTSQWRPWQRSKDHITLGDGPLVRGGPSSQPSCHLLLHTADRRCCQGPRTEAARFCGAGDGERPCSACKVSCFCPLTW